MTAGTAALVALAVPAAVANAAAKSPGPERWDPRIRGLVRFVERTRGLDFDHPIPVDFLSDQDFVRELEGDDDVTAADRRDAAHQAGQLRAVGLIEGDVDLIDANRALDAASVTGFYDDRKHRMVVRGTNLDSVEVRVTIVHELTHALQDQSFGLHALDREVDTSGEVFAETALIEGDASYVEEEYVLSLSEPEQDEYFNAAGEATKRDATVGPAVPPVLDVISSAPYVFGTRFVSALVDADGITAVDARFRDLPRSEEEIVDPLAAVDHEPPRPLRRPTTEGREKRYGSADDFGAFSLFVVLAARIDVAQALRASEGWGGDRMITFERDGRECVRVAFQGDTPTDTREIRAALGAWTAAMPAGAATLVTAHGRPTLTACEAPGTTAPSAATLERAVDVLVNRNDVYAALAGRASHKAVRCAADKVVTDPSVAQLVGKEIRTPAEQRLIEEAASADLRTCSG